MHHTTLRSVRDHAIFSDNPESPATVELTVEDYTKWYGLQVVQRNCIEEIPFIDDKHLAMGIGPCYRDHVPNPYVTRRYAEVQGWHIPERAWEVMVGRWIIELSDDYPVVGVTLVGVAPASCAGPAFTFSMRLPEKKL